MGRIRRGGYIFVTRKADHAPQHVHVFRDGRLAVKWDLERREVMKGEVTARLLLLIRRLEAEGKP